jgi:hypothetical protein
MQGVTQIGHGPLGPAENGEEPLLAHGAAIVDPGDIHTGREPDQSLPGVLDVRGVITDHGRALDQTSVLDGEGAGHLVRSSEQNLHHVSEMSAAVHDHPATGQYVDPAPLEHGQAVVEQAVVHRVDHHGPHVAQELPVTDSPGTGAGGQVAPHVLGTGDHQPGALSRRHDPTGGAHAQAHGLLDGHMDSRVQHPDRHLVVQEMGQAQISGDETTGRHEVVQGCVDQGPRPLERLDLAGTRFSLLDHRVTAGDNLELTAAAGPEVAVPLHVSAGNVPAADKSDRNRG